MCSQTCSAEVQRSRGRHSWNVHRAAMPGEWGIPSSTVPLVPQQRGAAPGPQSQSEVCQLLLQHKPGHRRTGEKHIRGLFLLCIRNPKFIKGSMFFFFSYSVKEMKKVGSRCKSRMQIIWSPYEQLNLNKTFKIIWLIAGLNHACKDND